MESDKDYIKKIFSSKFSNFEPDLPDSVWNRVEMDLSLLTPVVKKKRLAIRKAIIVSIGAAAVLAIAVFTLNNVIDPENIPSKIVAEKIVVEIDKVKEDNAQPGTDKEDLLLSPSNNMMANLAANTSVASSYKADALELESYTEKVESYDQVVEEKEAVELIALNDAELHLDRIEEIEENSFADFEKNLEEQIAAFEREGEALKRVLADNTSNPSKKKKEGFGFGVEAGSSFNKGDDAKNQFNTTYDGVQYSGPILLRTQRMKLEHNQPITFGLNISKRLNNKLSIESGVTYTYLSSRMISDDKSDIQQKDRQYFNYFGIPLMLNYTFAEWEKIKFYASFGGMIQKDFYGRISSRMHVDGLIGTEEDHKEKISQKNPQFSTMATLGLSYPIYKDIRVYGNFGGAHYFDAKNEYETIYSDKKWLFNMNVGLKFEF